MTKKAIPRKKLNKSIDLILQIVESTTIRVCIDNGNLEQGIKLRKAERCFKYEIDGSLLYGITQKDTLKVKLDLLPIEVSIPSLPLNELDTGAVITGEIHLLYSSQFDTDGKYFYRLFLPISEDLNFWYSIENIPITYEYFREDNSREAIKVKIDCISFYLYRARENKKRTERGKDFLIVDCDCALSFNEFSEYCHSILISFGFVAGKFVQDEGFFIQYNENEMATPKDFYYTALRRSINSFYTPVHSNPYNFLYRNKEVAEKYAKKTRGLTLTEFSKVCELTHSNEDFKSVLLLILESAIPSLVSKPGLLSIALETVAKVVYKKNEKAFAPVKDKSLFQKVKEDIVKVLDGYKDTIGEEGFNILVSRTENWNQKTNTEKLLIPFKILNIPINKYDEEAIGNRNKFLHGSNPMIKKTNWENDDIAKMENADKSDKFRYYLYLKLYVLLSSVILKQVGFDGLGVNFPKIFESHTGFKLDEDYFKQI